MNEQQIDPFIRYCLLNRGEATRIANALGLTLSAVSKWKKVPEKYLPEVSRLTGIPIKELDPRFDQGSVS